MTNPELVAALTHPEYWPKAEDRLQFKKLLRHFLVEVSQSTKFIRIHRGSDKQLRKIADELDDLVESLITEGQKPETNPSVGQMPSSARPVRQPNSTTKRAPSHNEPLCEGRR